MGLFCLRISDRGRHDDYKQTKLKQFLNMKQRNLTVGQYENKFSRLSKYAPKLVLMETFRCRQFEDGLKV